MTYDTKGIWRCYEIKVSKSDFYSKSKKTFIGHYNYFVMPEELYEEVKNDIPNHVGVHTGDRVIKNPKKQELTVDEQILKDSLIRSLSRENEKFIRACDTNYINELKRSISRMEKRIREEIDKYYKIQRVIYKLCDNHSISYDEVRKLLREEDEE